MHVERGELDLDRFSDLLDEADGADPVLAAEKLRAALALFRGSPLADLAYESFAQAAIARIDELRLAALERRIDVDLALGRHVDLVAELETLVGEHPLREPFRGQLMLALYRSGRQSEALAAYQATREALLDGLGIEPSPALRGLELAILRQDPELNLTRLPVSERSILVTAEVELAIDALLELAGPLAKRPPKELILVRLTHDGGALGAVTAGLLERRARLHQQGVSSRVAAFVSASPADDLLRLAAEQDVDLVLGAGVDGELTDSTLLRLLEEAPCDVAIVVRPERKDGPVLVPFVGVEHDWAAVELASWLAGALDVSLVLAGPKTGQDGQDASRLLANASLAVQATLGIAAEPLLLDTGPDSLLATAANAGVTVVGLPDRWREQGLGAVRGALLERAGSPVILVRRGLRPGGLAPRESLTRFTWSMRA